MAGRMLHEAYLLLGGNMGNRNEFLEKARNEIEKHCGQVVRASSIYETAAWGMEEQENFLNQVILINTDLGAVALLQMILGIEESLGRKRDVKYGSRTIDIDILFYDDAIINLEGLTIPHPQLHKRRFVLIPLEEITAEKIHPVIQKSMKQLLMECPDHLNVNKIV